MITYPRPKFAKRTDSGGAANPGVPEGYEPLLPALTDEQWNADMAQVIEIGNIVEAGEFPAQMFHDVGVPSEIPDPLAPLVAAAEADPRNVGLPLGKIIGRAVRMDRPVQFADALQQWAAKNEIRPAKRYRLADDDQVDFLATVIRPTEFMLEGLTAAMIATGHEKWFWEQARPEEVVEQMTGIDPCWSTDYVEGCPFHPERPAWHGVFAGWVAARARRYYIGPGVDQVIRAAGLHVALWRVPPRMHTVRSCVEGFELAESLEAEYARAA